MKHILRILSKSIVSIVIIIALLFVQARCDLALPDYTANIVNIGIQQGGINDSVYDVVSKSTMDKLLIFKNSNDKEKILMHYKIIKKGNKKYIQDYSLLKTEDIYILKSNSQKNRETLEEELITPMLIVNVLENENFDKTVLYEELANNMNVNIATVKQMNLLDLFANMPDEAKDTMIKEFSSKFTDLGKSIQRQYSISTVKQEYIKVGVNVKKMQIGYIVSVGIKMLIVALIAMIITIITSFLASRVGAIFAKRLRKDVVENVVNFSTSEYKEFSVASLITRSTNDIQQVQMVLILLLRMVIYAPILGIGALTKVSGSPIAWIIGVGVGAILLVVVTLFTIALPRFKKLQTLVDRVNLVFRETLTGLPVIRAFANEKHEEKRFDKANVDLTKMNLFVSRLMSVMMPTMMFIMNGISILIIWVGASKVDIGVLQVGDLLAFITYSMQIIISFLMLSMISIMLPRSWVSVKRIAEVLDTESSIKQSSNPKEFDKAKKGLVEFKDVYFRYPDANEDVLQNISFKAKTGTTTAFIGSTGSGKSTLINLIPRLFDVTAGKILIDGIDIKDAKLSELRDKIGFVPQKGILFSGTIESNIKFSDENITNKEMKKAASIAQAMDFIEEKDDKFNSLISQGGTNVSGGQKQRLSIARAIAKNPEIYVFDDSFSALDFKTDAALRKALEKETKDTTIFIVAQRISTILNADQIIVLDKGQIVGMGTHQELLNSCDVYREIALSQLSEEELS